MKTQNGSVFYQHDTIVKKKRKPSCLQKFSSIIANALENCFYKLGCVIGKYPAITIIICLIVVGVCAAGINFFYEEARPGNLWVPSNSLAVEHKKWIDDNYPSDFIRLELVLIEAENVIEPSTLNALLAIDKKIKAIDLNDGINWEDMCARLGQNCWMNGILEVWSFNETVMADLSGNDIIDDVNRTNISPISGAIFEVEKYLGGIVRDQTGKIVSAKAALFQYILKSNDSLENEEKEGNVKARLWEKALINLLESGLPGVTNIYYNAQRSNPDVGNGAIFGDLNLLFAGFVLIIVFVACALGKFNFVHHRIYLAMCGVMCIGFSILVSIGLSSYADIFFGPLHNVLPFLLLGIGVDDMFVIVQAYEVQKNELKDKPIHERTGHMLKAAGVSITVTSITDIAAFGVGATTKIPALSSFCIYACIGIIAIYLLSATFFVACFTLDNRRAEGNRNACCCCYVHKPDYKPNQCSEKEFVQTYFDKYYGTILTKLPVKILVLFITAGLLALNIYGVVNVKQDFDPNWFIPSDTYLRDYLDATEMYFPDEGVPAFFYIGEIDYPGNISRLVQLHNDMNGMETIYTEKLPTTDKDFYDLLLVYLFGDFQLGTPGEGSRFIRDVVFNETNSDFTVPRHVQISKVGYKHSSFDDAKSEITAMKDLRELFKQTGLDIYPFTHFYLLWEGNDVIQTELYRNVGLAFLCVFVITLILIAHPWTCILVSSCIIATVVDVVGLVYWWGLTIDTVTSINTILAVGLAVDYAAHIGHTFMTVDGNRNERTCKTMSKMGPAVLYGGVSTFLAFILLAGSTSYVFRVFFRVFFGVVVFGLFHGMVFLPVMLSLVGPAPYLKPGDENNSVKGDFDDIPDPPPQVNQAEVITGNGTLPQEYTTKMPTIKTGSILGTENQAFNPEEEYAKVDKHAKKRKIVDIDDTRQWHWKDDTSPQQKWSSTLPIKGNWNHMPHNTAYPKWEGPWTPYPTYYTVGAKPHYSGIPNQQWRGGAVQQLQSSSPVPEGDNAKNLVSHKKGKGKTKPLKRSSHNPNENHPMQISNSFEGHHNYYNRGKNGGNMNQNGYAQQPPFNEMYAPDRFYR